MIVDKFIDKYHPATIDDMILTKELKAFFTNMLDSNNLTDMTFVGPPGIGKTTVVDLLAKRFDASVLFIPCGIEGNIDTVKTKIKDFVNALDIEGRIKIVVLDEADQLSGSDTAQLASSAQKALRSLMGDKQNKDIRWLLTANYENKLIAPIKSRCPVVKLHYTVTDLVTRLLIILAAEKIQYSKDDLKVLVNDTIKPNYPDIRKILNILQTQCSTGKLIVQNSTEAETDYSKLIDELHTKLSEVNSTPLSIRQYILQNKTIFNDNFPELAATIMASPKFESYLTVSRIEKLVEYIYKMGTVIDPEIQFFGFCTALMNKNYN